MWPWDWNLDWKGIAVSVITLIIGGVLTAVWIWFRENRRKISFTASDVYFGPTMSMNTLMGREYPQEDSIELDCNVSFFSYKTQGTGLQNVRFEFCRSTYMGPQVELTITAKSMIRDMQKQNTPYTLETLDLPPRQFVSFSLHTWLDRSKWSALRLCDKVRLSCATPEGRTKHFKVASIRFPDMPPDGFRGQKYMGVHLRSATMGPDGRSVVMALRKQKLEPPGVEYPAEDKRYWSGSEWVRSITEARTYTDPKVIHAEVESLKLWHRVPEEWQNDERE